MPNTGSDKDSGIAMGFPFRMVNAIEAININLKVVFVSEMRFGYEYYVHFFVKQQVSYLQFMLAP